MDYLCINKEETVLTALECIKKNHQRCVIVLNHSGKVDGVVSQGDIANALLNGTSQYAAVEKIMNPSFLYLTENDLDSAYALFKKYQISLIPILNQKFELQGVITIQDIFNYLEKRK